ncbi:Cupin superfamily protein [Microlunatus sagamiharensis]|uniref:Cupin superfamily protein n=1 Tax=Microlunatus sagamiharensis TaxID=546874 RepID=A0A1H2LS35_9ACTN|nr:cupin domain-containing protein [Microlunatus sagamiharensis]SDU83823.1 Cupin superfamily protein [Microlunatus sagamiharensis]
MPDRPTSALDRLVAVDRATFADEYWGRRALLSRAADLGGTFTDLLDEPTVDELVSERGLRTPFLRVAKSGQTLGDRAFTAPGGVGAGIADQVSDSKLVGLFGDGATMVLQALHRVWPPIIHFVGALAAELGHPVQANAYVTPPQNQGFDDHYDVHDVFVLQVSGTKEWRIHAPVWDAPLRDQPWTDRRTAVQRAAAEPPLIKAVLEPGDCLYLPRGFLHAATALGGVSTHLTLGVHTWTRYALAEQLTTQALARLAGDAAVRGSLALGTDPTRADTLADDVEQVRAALLEAVRTADLDTVAAALRRADRDSRRPAPVGPLAQLGTLDALADGTALHLRDHLAATLDQAGGRSVLRSRAGEVALDEDDVAPVKALLDEGRATAGDLGDGLARRLLLGAVVVAG